MRDQTEYLLGGVMPSVLPHIEHIQEHLRMLAVDVEALESKHSTAITVDEARHVERVAGQISETVRSVWGIPGGYMVEHAYHFDIWRKTAAFRLHGFEASHMRGREVTYTKLRPIGPWRPTAEDPDEPAFVHARQVAEKIIGRKAEGIKRTITGYAVFFMSPVPELMDEFRRHGYAAANVVYGNRTAIYMMPLTFDQIESEG